MVSRRVLIVEDEWLIARDHEQILTAAGHIAVGPVATVAKAVALMEAEQVDIALLDFQLGSQTSAPLAQQLVQRGIPFIVVTGHSGADLSAEFASGLIVAKPASPQQLLSAIELLAIQGQR
jgi:DNA-binding response OmpR family regulator